jgi:hypothetical protein
MAAIDIGPGAIDRDNAFDVYTIIEKGNPANDTGIITSVELWPFTWLTGCEMATFFVISGNNLSTRDTVYLGEVGPGSKQTFDISATPLDVSTGDYLGYHYYNGALEAGVSGGSGVWYKAGDYIPCTNEAFSPVANYVGSVYGTGTTPVGRSWGYILG